MSSKDQISPKSDIVALGIELIDLNEQVRVALAEFKNKYADLIAEFNKPIPNLDDKQHGKKENSGSSGNPIDTLLI